MGTESANSRFVKIILQHLQAVLKPHGFQKRGRTFVADGEGVTLLVNLQSSTSSTEDELLATINLAVHLPRLAERTGAGKETLSKSVWDSHWSRRIGHLMEHQQDYWWRISDDEQAERAGNHMANILRRDGLPALLEVAAIDKLKTLWEQGQSPGLTERQRDRYLELLKA